MVLIMQSITRSKRKAEFLYLMLAFLASTDLIDRRVRRQVPFSVRWFSSVSFLPGVPFWLLLIAEAASMS